MEKNLISKSFKTLKKYPILLTPDLLFYLLLFLSTLLILFFSDLFPFLNLLITSENIEETIKTHLEEYLGTLIAAFISYVLVYVLLGIGFQSIKYSMLKLILVNNKLSLFDSLKESKSYLIPLIGLKVFYLLLLVFLTIVLIIIFFIAGKLYVALGPSSSYISVLVFSVFSLITLVLVLFFLSFLFRLPILFLDRENPINTIKFSLNFFLKNKKTVIYTALVILISIIITFLFYMATNAFLSSSENFQDTYFFGLVIVITSLLQIVIRIIYKVFTDLYIFNVYKETSKKSLAK